MAQRESFCLDVFIEGKENLRESLINFLKRERKDFDFDIGAGQCGNWEGLMSLRILTPQAKVLITYIIRNIKGAEDYSYDDHYSKGKAENSQFWIPDNNKPFDFVASRFEESCAL